MRPVERGSPPTDPTTGTPKCYQQYQDARDDLIARLGEYCSYCEMRLEASLAVEHVKPKAHYPGQALVWSNFLLSCVHCNSIKGCPPVSPDCLWPDIDNTFAALIYGSSGEVDVCPALAPALCTLARETIELTGLDRRPGHPQWSPNDRRWVGQLDAWGAAQEARRCLLKHDAPEVRNVIVTAALGRGHWSIWMTVFQGDADMLGRFARAFQGTCQGCFDSQYRPVPRPGGRV